MNDNYWSTYGNLYTTTTTTASLAWNVQPVYVDSCKATEDKLKEEIKELKRMVANLNTLVCTHIGKEQLEKFNKEHE